MDQDQQVEDEGAALWAEIAAEEDGTEVIHAEPQEGAAPATPKVEAPAPEDEKPDPVSALQKQVEELTGLVKSSVGRIGALQSEIAKRDAAPAPSHTQVAVAAKSTEKWKQLKSDFPDWADAVEEFVSANASPQFKPDEIVERATKSVAEAVDAAHVKTAKQLASFAEPGWDKVVNSDEFNQWIATQPAAYVAKAAEASANWDAVEVVSVVRDFRKATTPTPTKARGTEKSGQSRLASAAVPAGSAATRKSTEDLEGPDYWKHLEQEERRSAA